MFTATCVDVAAGHTVLLNTLHETKPGLLFIFPETGRKLTFSPRFPSLVLGEQVSSLPSIQGPGV